MADNKITREVYKQYANKIVSVLNKEGFYEQFKKRVDKGASSFKLAKKRLVQDISIDWIDTIESILPNLDTIVRNPRKFIVQEEDIVDVSLGKKYFDGIRQIPCAAHQYDFKSRRKDGGRHAVQNPQYHKRGIFRDLRKPLYLHAFAQTQRFRHHALRQDQKGVGNARRARVGH